jgi:hypothetical protein
MSYGSDTVGLYRRVAFNVDRIVWATFGLIHRRKRLAFNAINASCPMFDYAYDFPAQS